ncbi:hypothetical protein L596_001327 [Steinernema carpocapsae]|uniref:Uncharacterized protein n=1 Tax=Steinernema carpocapsae TaxID=34508 RepID=A0A4U8UMZ1_STECR|nr:hypothetical protein L596_001327 [Steinernema carpocapsae]
MTMLPLSPAIVVRPMKNSRNWQFSLLAWNDKGIGDDALVHLTNLDDFFYARKIEGITVEGCWDRDYDPGPEWVTVDQFNLKTVFLPFLTAHLYEHPELYIDAEPGFELNCLLRMLFDAVGSCRNFAQIFLRYYGPICERFLISQISTSHLEFLNLFGQWPFGTSALIKAFLTTTESPSLTLDARTEIYLDRDLLDVIFEKFEREQLTYLKELHGKLKVPKTYLEQLGSEKVEKCSVSTPDGQEKLTWEIHGQSTVISLTVMLKTVGSNIFVSFNISCKYLKST